MARFEFRLEPLLKLRKMRQEQSERELAQRITQFLHHRKQVAAIESQIADCYGQIRRQHAAGDIQITGLIADRRYLNQLHHLRHQELTAVARHQQLVDQARRQVAQAKKQTDMMSTLKDKMHQRFRKEQDKRETIELDDLTNAKVAWSLQREGLGE